jgi:hypothetical protein
MKPSEETVLCFIFYCGRGKVDRIGVVHCSKMHRPNHGDWEKQQVLTSAARNNNLHKTQYFSSRKQTK